METIFVITLFALYLILWRIRQVNLIRKTGIDPQVMGKSRSNVQIFFSTYILILTIYGTLIIPMLAFNIQIGSLFSRVAEITALPFDIAGFITGVAGMSLCLVAQLKMGASWRVGIDEKVSTNLVTSGMYAYIRNPTYVGLFFFNVGLWMIWPTWVMFLLNLLFFLFLEIQVRCEEDFLTLTHGDEYLAYKNRTKRNIPHIY